MIGQMVERMLNLQENPAGSSHSGTEVRQYLYCPSGQQIRGQQSKSSVQFFTGRISISGLVGHSLGMIPKSADRQMFPLICMLMAHGAYC